MAWDLDNYNDVPARIAEFRAKHPEGSLQARIIPFEEHGIPGVVMVEARAYRSPDDLRPGVGLAQEPVPGKTPYTKDSETQNAETSAWGRAIIAVGAADARKGVASREEVRNRQAPPVSTTAGSDHKTDSGATPMAPDVDLPAPTAGGEALDMGKVDAPPPALPADQADAFALLLSMAGGNLSRAASVVNKANKTSYTKTTVTRATVQELDAGMSALEEATA